MGAIVELAVGNQISQLGKVPVQFLWLGIPERQTSQSGQISHIAAICDREHLANVGGMPTLLFLARIHLAHFQAQAGLDVI